MKNRKLEKAIKVFLFSSTSFIFGFIALVVPFKLFDLFGKEYIKDLLVIEIITYFSIAFIFAILKEIKKSNSQNKKYKKLHTNRLDNNENEDYSEDLVA